MTFGEIEALIGTSLPDSARRRDWWSNRSSALQAAAWMEAGYHVKELDLPQERVTFYKPKRRYAVRREDGTVAWNGELIKDLRAHLGMSQSQLAEEIGVRQQTVSEWETGIYAPSRAMCKYLSIIAERVGFSYNTSNPQGADELIHREDR